ncbi:MAG: Co2+/Mg2+ efflux protein ApaG [Geminicoccaceae bacterium]|nr:Co2+/Mg2+ efflux protein ApaG [Geminicoccaceae bacterium]
MPYEAVTRSIRITVEPFYIAGPEDGRWSFAYTVAIRNEGDAEVRLMSRHWRVVDGRGHLVEHRGEGVVGEQPVLPPGGGFTYTSGVRLPTASGFMTGAYQMLGADGLWFDAVIPAFALDAPSPCRSVN